MIWSFHKQIIVNRILVRKRAAYQQLVYPEKYQDTVYIKLHEMMALVGSGKVIELAKQRFDWPMRSEYITDNIVKRCCCIVTKNPNVEDWTPLVPIRATYPFEMIALDFLHIDKCQGGFEYVMIVVDHLHKCMRPGQT